MRRMLLLVLALAVAVSVPALGASSTKLKAKMTGGAEVPKGNPKASGSATFTIAANGKSIKYTLSAKKLSGPVIASPSRQALSSGRAAPTSVRPCVPTSRAPVQQTCRRA